MEISDGCHNAGAWWNLVPPGSLDVIERLCCAGRVGSAGLLEEMVAPVRRILSTRRARRLRDVSQLRGLGIVAERAALYILL